MSKPLVPLMRLSERTSTKGRRYLSGWLGKTSVVTFEATEPEKYGNKVGKLFLSAPEPRNRRGDATPPAGTTT